MKKFKLHWLGGKTEIVEGHDIVDACRRSGIGAGALAAMDSYKEIPTPLSDITKMSIADLLQSYANGAIVVARLKKAKHKTAAAATEARDSFKDEILRRCGERGLV